MWGEGKLSTRDKNTLGSNFLFSAGSFHLPFWEVRLIFEEMLVFLAGSVMTPLRAACVTQSCQPLCPCSTQ